uniref:Uncharacterized protein n=1 Tax=Panagrolaimus superbus TaxID=310955 RepID=A0A914XW78_9BILA
MLWKLATFIESDLKNQKFNPFSLDMRSIALSKIRDFVTKEDGTIMNSIEQFERFAKFLNEKGYFADIFIYEPKNQQPILKTSEHENPPFIIAVVKLPDRNFAATSIYNCFIFDLKKRLLRIQPKARKEKKIGKYNYKHRPSNLAIN